MTDHTHDGHGEESPMPTSPMQSAEVPEEAVDHLSRELGVSRKTARVNLEEVAPALRKQGAEQERERVIAARRDTEGVPFLDAARALCPDGAHWEDFRERYEADASACLHAFLAALDTGGSDV